MIFITWLVIVALGIMTLGYLFGLIFVSTRFAARSVILLASVTTATALLMIVQAYL